MRIFRIIFIIFSLFSQSSIAVNIIRDDEIEKNIKDLLNPVIVAANLSQDDIKIYLVNDNAPNAFVSNGSNIFINTGLIVELDDPDAVIAVLAHEIGHIKENHLIRRNQIYKNQNNFIVSSVLLGALSISAGAADIGSALITAGSHMSERTLLKYSREFEEAADQAAMKYLDKSYGSSVGLMKSFEYFTKLDKIYNAKNNSYSITHPLSIHRFKTVTNHLKNLPKKTNLSLEKRMNFDRIMVKLKSFILKPEKLLYLYKDDDVNSIYARSIAYYRMNDIKTSELLLQKVIEQEPKNSYLHELLGQFYFEQGIIDLAISSYEHAEKLNSNSVFIKLGLANSYITKYDDDKIFASKAITLLNDAENIDENNDLINKSLSIIYGKINNLGKANFYLAKEMIAKGNFDKAKYFAKKSLGYLNKNSTDFFKAEDIIQTSILQKK